MDHLMDLPLIASDDDWLELRDGTQALLRGQLHSKLRNGQDALVVKTESWDLFAVTIRGGYSGIEYPEGTRVSVIAARCEDGLEMSSADLTAIEEEN